MGVGPGCVRIILCFESYKRVPVHVLDRVTHCLSHMVVCQTVYGNKIGHTDVY